MANVRQDTDRGNAGASSKLEGWIFFFCLPIVLVGSLLLYDAEYAKTNCARVDGAGRALVGADRDWLGFDFTPRCVYAGE